MWLQPALLHEFNEHPSFRVRPVMDLAMLAMCNGHERNLAQWESLFQQSGFRLKRVYETRSPINMIEASPV